MNWEQKYLKYKNKYLALKNQIGKGTELDGLKTNSRITHLLNMLIRLEPDSFNLRSYAGFISNIKRSYDDEKLYNELKELDDKTIIPVEDNFDLLSKAFNKLNLINYNIDLLQLGPGMKLLLDKLGISIKRSCSVEQFMTIKNPNLNCNNPTLVEGSCGEPSFFSQLENINPENDKIMELLELIETKLEAGKTIGIVVGAMYSDEFYSQGDLTLFISPIATSSPIDLIIEQLKSSELKSNYKINGYFPTNQMGDNQRVLDKIISLTDKYNIKFVNKMCGSCFRSMWYLVKKATKNFTYEVSPSQGLNPITDSEAIQRCFSKK